METDNIKSLYFWKAVLAEALGTFFLVLIGCGTVLATQDPDGKNVKNDVVQIALSFGLAVATMVWCISHVSGGHINPAVTVAFMVTRRMSLLKALCYIIAQTGGATFGAWLLSVCANEPSNLGVTQPHSAFNYAQTFGIESMITFVLVFTVFSTCDTGRDDLEGSGPLAIGLSVTLCHLFAAPFTGSSMNPARSFGPALVTGKWELQWIYWLSPIAGGIVAALLYENFFAVGAGFNTFKSMFLTKRIADAGPPEPDDEAEGSEDNCPIHDCQIQVTDCTRDRDQDRDRNREEDLQMVREKIQAEKHQACKVPHDRHARLDRARGHHVGKLATPRWYLNRQISLGTGLTPQPSLIALTQINQATNKLGITKAAEKVSTGNLNKVNSRDSILAINS